MMADALLLDTVFEREFPPLETEVDEEDPAVDDYVGEGENLLQAEEGYMRKRRGAKR